MTGIQDGERAKTCHSQKQNSCNRNIQNYVLSMFAKMADFNDYDGTVQSMKAILELQESFKLFENLKSDDFKKLSILTCS